MDAETILVTGASGFVGRHVVAPLVDRGFRVHCAGRTAIDLEGCQYHAADAMAEGAIDRVLRDVQPGTLLHLAWDTEPGAFWTSRLNLDWVGASLRLYRVFSAAGGRRAVLVGSCAEYDWSYQVLTENATPCRPATLYGIAKHALHSIAAEAAALDGVELAWGRIFHLYGPGEKPGRLVSDVVRSLLCGEPVETTIGRQVRAFLHVADVAEALAALAASDVTGPVNIAGSEPHTLAELLAVVGDALGRRDLLRLGARPLSPGDPNCLLGSCARLRDEVGFTPRYDLDAGIRDTIDWWRGQLAGTRPPARTLDRR